MLCKNAALKKSAIALLPELGTKKSNPE